MIVGEPTIAARLVMKMLAALLPAVAIIVVLAPVIVAALAVVMEIVLVPARAGDLPIVDLLVTADPIIVDRSPCLIAVRRNAVMATWPIAALLAVIR